MKNQIKRTLLVITTAILVVVAFSSQSKQFNKADTDVKNVQIYSKNK